MPREGERGKEKKGAKIGGISIHFNATLITNCTVLHLLTYTCLLETNILAHQNLLFVIGVKLKITKPTVNRTSASVLAQ